MSGSIARGLVGLGLVVVLAGCSSSATSGPSPSPSVPPTAAASASETPSAAPSATAAPSVAGGPSLLPSEAPSAVPSAVATASSGTSGAAGGVEIVVGGGTASPGNGDQATAILLKNPVGLAVAPGPVLWITDAATNTIRVIRAGIASTIDGSLAAPVGLAVNAAADVYVADPGSYRVLLSKHAGGGLVVVTGSATVGSGSTGDGGLARKALVSSPGGLAVDGAGNLYIADVAAGRIRRVDARTGRISTVAGVGGEGYAGDNGPATHAKLANPKAVAVTSDGSLLYIADYGNGRVRQVNLATGTITTVAGDNGAYAAYNTSLTALQTPLSRLNSIAVDGAGMIYVPAFYNDIGVVIVRIDPSAGTVTPVFGGGKATAPGGSPTDFALGAVAAMAIDPATGDLYVATTAGVVYRAPGVAAPTP